MWPVLANETLTNVMQTGAWKVFVQQSFLCLLPCEKGQTSMQVWIRDQKEENPEALMDSLPVSGQSEAILYHSATSH